MPRLITPRHFAIRASAATAIARDLVALRADDVWLATFPKTGSSWLRSVLAFLAHGQDAGLTELDREMPSLGSRMLSAPWTGRTARFVKTHHAFRPVLFGRPSRTLLLVRDPRDTLASLHHMLSQRKVGRFEGDLSALLRHPRYGLAAYLGHYQSWAPRATAVIRYESMQADAVSTLSEAFAALGQSVSEADLAEAVERSSLQRMRAREEASGIANGHRFDAEFSFVRRSARREAATFSDADEAFYQQLRRDTGVDLYP